MSFPVHRSDTARASWLRRIFFAATHLLVVVVLLVPLSQVAWLFPEPLLGH
jgi:hypothetical protein